MASPCARDGRCLMTRTEFWELIMYRAMLLNRIFKMIDWVSVSRRDTVSSLGFTWFIVSLVLYVAVAHCIDMTQEFFTQQKQRSQILLERDLWFPLHTVCLFSFSVLFYFSTRLKELKYCLWIFVSVQYLLKTWITLVSSNYSVESFSVN